MKNLEDYSAEPVFPSSYLTQLHMGLCEGNLILKNHTFQLA